jgi:hypothetical protein
VVVDHVRLRAEQVIVRRHGLVLRRRRATIDAGAVEAVVPASQLLLVGPASRGAKTPSLARQVLRRAAAGLAVGLAAGLVAARREAPRLERWLGRSARAASLRLRAAARIAARVLGELAVLAAVLAAAAWRRAAARPEPRDPDAPQGPGDADAPLGREISGEARTPAGTRRRR